MRMLRNRRRGDGPLSIARLHRRTDAARADESGFTLIELMMVIIIMPLVLGAISVVLITTFKDQAGVSSRISDSADAQVTSAFYVRDVESAAYVTTDELATGPATCDVGSPPGTFLLGLYWSGNGGYTVVSYFRVGTTTLERVVCANGSSPPTSAVVLTKGLASSAIAFAVSPSTESTDAGTGWTTTAGVSNVTLAATEQGSGYQFNLLAAPRAWTPQSGGVPAGGSPAPPPLLLLGSGGSILQCSGNGTLNVDGEIALDSTANGSAVLNGNATATATSFYTADTSSPTSALSKSGNASYTPSSTPNSGPPIADPYQSLTPPSTTGMTTHSGGSYQGPGIYTSTLSLSGNASQVFASGIYILENGISVTGNASISTASGGVFFYVTGGTVAISGNGGVSLEPLASPPSPIANLVLWQANTDTNAVTLTGNGSGSLVDGTVYAPTAQVGGSGNASLTAGSVIARGLSCDGNGSTTIG